MRAFFPRIACGALLALGLASGCDHSWALNVDALVAERLTDTQADFIKATVTVTCRERGEKCPSTYCVALTILSDNQTMQLDTVESCSTMALSDDQTAMYELVSSKAIPDPKLKIKAECTVAASDSKGDGNTGAKQIDFPSDD